MNINKQKQNSKSLQGSFTIEMSILMPVILLLILSIIYLLFFLYDESCAVQIAYLGALRGAKQMESDEHKIEAVNTYCESMQEELMWAIKSQETIIDCKDSNVSVELKGQVFTPMGNRLFRNAWDYRIKSTAEHIKAVKIIRLCRKFEGEKGE